MTDSESIDSLSPKPTLEKPRRPDLKARPLDPRTPDLNTKRRVVCVALAVLYSIAVIIAIALLPMSRRDITTDDCGEGKSLSAMERRFQIDIATAEHLSFSRAKMIDLSWDIGIGQGGRLLHGWILYHVAAKTVTWILETSALPYSLLFDLLFYVDSLPALWSLVRLLGKGDRYRFGVLARAFLLALAVLQVLIFAAIWSAATGYQSPGMIRYAMPDQSWVTRDSDELRMCWKLESERPELTGLIDGAILGPKYATLFTSFKKSASSEYSVISDEYSNMQAYLQSKYTVRAFLDGLSKPSLTGSITVAWNETAGFEYNYLASSGGVMVMVPVSYNTMNNTNSDDVDEIGHLPNTIKGWQLPGIDQTSKNMFWVNATRYGSQQQLVRAVFELNASVPFAHTPGTVPYNSTLWYKGVEVSLKAPFLGFVECTWLQFKPDPDEPDSHHPGYPPNCLCYKGEPLLEEFRLNSHQVCTGGADYIWGFSYFLTRLGLMLELFWCVICLYLWLSSVRQGNIALRDRSNPGALRNALDLAEAVREELGDNTCLYTNAELLKALSGTSPAGYAVKDRGDGVGHLGLVPVREGPVRRKLLLDPDKLYG